MWIAGGGEKKTLRTVAKYGDYSNFAGDVDTFSRKSRILDAHCEAVGRDPSEIGRTVHMLITVLENESDFESVMTRVAAQAGRDLDTYMAGSQSVVGTAEQVIEQIGAYKDAGAVHVTGYFWDSVWGDSIDRFAADVMPALR
jgi:alkanesulfonate monooxygenase SsuD/methylene tetrahydromethanopterin reductase-like flavin-dependent oxidoreductase (luciferase family)